MIVTAHAPTYLPGTSVLAKVARADTVIWLDGQRFTSPGYVNRNQLPNGDWLVVPVERPNHRSAIRDVTIGPGDEWQAAHTSKLLQLYGEKADGVLLDMIRLTRAGERLDLLNVNLLQRVLELAGLNPQQHRQSEWRHVGSLSDKTARMVRDLGGDVYLSGPGGRRFLDRAIFERYDVELTFFEYRGPNFTCIDQLFKHGKLPTPAADGHKEAVVST